MFWSSSSSVFISEVSVDGRNERIELTNSWESIFSWSVRIEWVKSSTLEVEIPTLKYNQSYVLWDKIELLTWVTLFSWQYESSLWLSLQDTSSHILSLFFSWTTLDTFTLSEQDSKNTDNSWQTFHKTFRGEYSIWPPSPRAISSLEGLEQDILVISWTTNEDSILFSGSVVGSWDDALSWVLVEEVSWNDNIDTTSTWTVELIGWVNMDWEIPVSDILSWWVSSAGSWSLIDIETPDREVTLESETEAEIPTENVSNLPGCDIRLLEWDNWRKLYVEEEICETSYVYQRQEILSQTWSSSWTEDRWRGCSFPLIIPHDQYMDVLLQVVSPEKSSTILCEDHLEVLIQDTQLEETSSSSLSWNITIVSLHPTTTEAHGEFLIIQLTEAYSWTLQIEWWWRWSASKELYVSGWSWDQFIIGDWTRAWSSYFSWFHSSSFLQLEGLSLTDTWEVLSLLRHDWQKMDSIVYWSSKKGTVLEFSWNFSWDLREFVSQIDLENEEEAVSSGKDDLIDNKTSPSDEQASENAEQDDWLDMVVSDDSFDGTKPSSEETLHFEEKSIYPVRSPWIISLVWVLPNPDGTDGEDEWVRVYLEWTSQEAVDISTLRINAWTRERPFSSEHVSLQPGENKTFFADFWLYNRDSCIRLENNDWSVIYDEICYPSPASWVWYEEEGGSATIVPLIWTPPSKILCPDSSVAIKAPVCTPSLWETQKSDPFSWTYSWTEIMLWEERSSIVQWENKNRREYEIRIEAVLPNPAWADGTSEKIRLENRWSESIDLWSFLINAWKRQRNLLQDGLNDNKYILAVWSSVELQWNFWLYNKESCIRLEDWYWWILDTVCYPSPKDDLRYSITALEQLQENEMDQAGDDFFDGSVKEWIDVMWPVVDLWIKEEESDSEDFSWWTVTIDSLLPNPDGPDTDQEGIQLTNNWTGSINLDKLMLNAGKRTISFSTLESTQTELLPWWPLTLYWTLWLYNSASCVRLENNQWVVYDEKCYPKPKTWIWYDSSYVFDLGLSESSWDIESREHTYDWTFSQDLVCPSIDENREKTPLSQESLRISLDEWLSPDEEARVLYEGKVWTGIELASPLVLFSTWSLQIEALLPNPSWSDSWNEGVRLMNLWTWTILISDLRLNAWKRSTTLSWWVLDAWWSIQLTQTFWLYNRPACVRLESEEGTIYDEFCYPQPKDNQRYSRSEWLTKNMSSFGWLWSLSLDLQDEQACILFEDEELLCKEIKELSKIRKKLETLDKKYEKNVRKIDTTNETNKKKQLLLNNEIALHKEFIYESMWLLRDQWWPVFYDTPLAQNYATWRDLQNSLWSLSFAQQHFFDDQVTTVYKLHGEALPLGDIEIWEIYSELILSTQWFLEDLKTNLSEKKSPLALSEDVGG